jgi:ADP-heptose:LPS heptosyltransferase
MPVFEDNPAIDAILPANEGEVFRWRPELTLNLHGGGRSARLTLVSRARLRAGFNHFRWQTLYNIRIPRAQEILSVERMVHTAEHLASAMFYLGVPAAEIPRASLFARTAPRERPYAVIHPMAAAADKTWPHENFLAVARHLEKRAGLEPVFIAGPGEDLGSFSEFPTFSGASLADIKSLLAGAALFVGNDSGPAHMAAAFGLPTVVLFGSSRPEIWHPWRTESVVLTSPSGILSIPVADALAATERLLASSRLAPVLRRER